MNKDLDLNSIEKLIRKGAIDGYQKNIDWYFLDSDYSSRMIEYLAVVSVAQSLWEYCRLRDLKLNLEYSLRDFYNGAFDCYDTYEDLVNGRIRKDHNLLQNEKQRIDIAILGNELKGTGSEDYNTGKKNYEPIFASLVGIEVKAINRQPKTIEKDIDRLSKALMLEDGNLKDENSINAGYSIFYRGFDNNKNSINKEQIDKKLEFELEEWNNILKIKRRKFKGLNIEITTPIPIKVKPLDKINIKEYHPDDFPRLKDETGAIYAFLIKITKKVV